jgi:hypothetical protein
VQRGDGRFFLAVPASKLDAQIGQLFSKIISLIRA